MLVLLLSIPIVFASIMAYSIFMPHVLRKVLLYQCQFMKMLFCLCLLVIIIIYQLLLYVGGSTEQSGKTHVQ